MYLIGVLLVTLATADECGNLCVSVSPSPCSDKGSYCKSKHACMDLFWLDRAAGTMCNSGSGCSVSDPVLCKEAAAQPKQPKSEPTSEPLTKTRNLLRTPHLPRNVESVNRGLLNTGSAGHFIAAVQALIHVPELRRSVLGREGQGPSQLRLIELFAQMGLPGDDSPIDTRLALAAEDWGLNAARVMSNLVAVYMQIQNQISSQIHEVYFHPNTHALMEVGPCGGLLPEGRGLPLSMFLRIHNDIIIASDILILNLASLNADDSKPKTSIDIPVELDLADSANTHYRLVSIVHHDRDHYVTDYLHVEEARWYRADGSRVTPLAHGPTRIGKTPYIVVYTKI